MHKTIDAVTSGIDGFLFNTSIAKLYAFTNTLAKSPAGAAAKKQAMRVMAQLMSPMTPHLAEEIWAAARRRRAWWPMPPGRWPTPRCWSTIP